MSKSEKSKLKPEHLLPFEKEPVSAEETNQGLLDVLGLDPDLEIEVDGEEEPEIDEEEEQDEDPPEEEEESSEEDEEEDDAEEEEEEEEAEEPEEDDEEEGDDEEDQTYTVKVRGKEVEVTLDELTAGYSRTKDYTEKTTELAEKRKALEAHEVEVHKVRDSYKAKLKVVEKIIKDSGPPERSQEYWDDLRAKNPAEYAAQRADLQQYNDELAAVEAEKEHVAQEEAESQSAARKEYLEGEWNALQEARPEWKDRDTFVSDMKALAAFAEETFGFTEEDLAGVHDHRLLLLLDYAHKGAGAAASIAKGKKSLKDKPVRGGKRMAPGGKKKRTSPGRKKSQAARKRFDDARKELTQSGSQHAARNALEELLDDDF
jgi:hypothetical protein